MRILVGGSLKEVPRDPDLCREFVAALGREIVKRGHVLLNGCRSCLDNEIAVAAQEWLKRNGGNPDKSIISYWNKNHEPVHRIGSIRQSALLDWQMNHEQLKIPEQVDKADATIFVAGHDGTFVAKNWALVARKPILGVPRFGGAGETVYNNELEHLRKDCTTVVEDYETLSQVSTDISRYAEEVIDLAERLVTPRSVFTIMSFEKKFRDVYENYKEVCKEFGFEAERTDESGSSERIVPRVETGIRGSAFVIADVSEQSPNVFYELGFARGLGKPLIMTYRKGTKLPFDVADIPAIEWKIPEDLKEGLRKRLQQKKGSYAFWGGSCSLL